MDWKTLRSMDWGPFTFRFIPKRRIAGVAFGDMQSLRRGAGAEHIGERDYEPGDDIRDIDWFATAKESLVRGALHPITREFDADESTPVVILVDRRPAMAIFPNSAYPALLEKPKAIFVAGSIIAESAFRQQCYVGYLDYADGEVPFWRQPNTETEVWRVQMRNLPHPHYRAPADNLSRAFRFLVNLGNALPFGMFLFVLSDFLVLPPRSLWEELVGHFEVVPVLIQDPSFEQSFPDIGGITVPLLDAESGRLVTVRYSRRYARRRREENEGRLRERIAFFSSLDLDVVILGTADPTMIHDAFASWENERRIGRR